MTVPPRAALYLRVSTARQAEHDVSITGRARCLDPGWEGNLSPFCGEPVNFNCRKDFCPAIAPKRPLSGSAMGSLQIA